MQHWVVQRLSLHPGRTQAFGFLLVFAVLVGYSLGDQLELTHDSGIYILLAQSLVNGEGYQEIYEVGPSPHTKYPPGFPLLLAPVVYLFDLNFWAMRLLITGLGVVALYAVYILFRRLAGDKMALTVLVLTGVSPGIWFYSQSILSEMPYLLFSFMGLFCLQRYQEEQGRISGKGWVAALTVGAASLTRTIGVALLLGGVVYLAFEGHTGKKFLANRRVAKSVFLAVMGGMPVALWFLRNWVVSSGTTLVAYLQEYGLKDYAYADSGMTGLPDLYALVHHNIYIYTSACSKIIFPYLAWLPARVTVIVLSTSILIGFTICLIKNRTVLEYYVPPYIGALLLFPASYSRYLIPLVPIIWYYFLIFLEESIRLIAKKFYFNSKYVTFASVHWIVFVLVVCFNLASLVQINILKNDVSDYHIDVGEIAYVNILPWVKENTDPSSIFMWSKPSLRYLLTKRRAVSLPTTSNREKVLEKIYKAGVNYVVLDSFSDRSRRYVKPVIDEHPEIFSPIHQNGTSMVYKVVR